MRLSEIFNSSGEILKKLIFQIPVTNMYLEDPPSEEVVSNPNL